MTVYPALVAVREDGYVPGPWTVQPGLAERGAASCDVNNRVLQIPDENTPQARVIRAHELFHARVSPTVDVMLAARELGISADALAAAEETRVNYLVGVAGFDIEALTDGSEKAGGRLAAENGAWADAVRALAAVHGTGASKPWFTGVRAARPEWVKPLRLIDKAIAKLLTRYAVEVVASTRIDDRVSAVLPEGFRETTIPIAQLIERYSDAAVPSAPEELRAFRRSLEPGARRPPTGQFARLVWLDQPEFARVDHRGSVRRPRPTTMGTSMRYPNRWLTDPQKRVMARKVRQPGGIVLIDQSGSMDIEPGVVREFARRNPRATLVGYSHLPGNHDGVANAWILASQGRVASREIGGNVGNGVDGPILEWAIAQREGNEPIVWVCDGQVTDSNDHPNQQLTEDCAQLVRTHRIRMVRCLEDVGSALLAPRPMRRTECGQFGRVGRVLAAS